MKNILKTISILLILILCLPSCQKAQKGVAYTEVATSMKVGQKTEDTSSIKENSEPISQTAETKAEQTTAKEALQESEQVKEQEQEQEPKREHLKVESREYKQFEEEVIRLANEERRTVGLEPLKTCDTYYKCVQIRAKECTQCWSHTRPDGRKYVSVYTDLPFGLDFVMLGENLGKNFVTAEQIVKALMASEPHRKNILNPEYTDICVAIVAMEGSEELYSKTLYAMAQHFYKKEELK